MLRSKPFYDFDSQGRLVEHSHKFDIELIRLVKANYEVTKEGIEGAKGALSRVKSESAGLTDVEDIEDVDAWISRECAFYDSLQVAARNLALVAVVTRLHSWVSRYARRLAPDRQIHPLTKELRFLEEKLGQHPPEPTDFFKELVDFRDSVVHADSQPKWQHKRSRQVAAKYVKGSQVEISHDDLINAIDAAIKQVKWYDDRLKAIHK